VAELEPLLSSQEVVKVFHDCREDASVLLDRHQVSLATVFDTQIAHLLWLERKNLNPYQASIAEVLRTFMQPVYRSHRWDELERKPIRAHLWKERPFTPQCLRYAIEGVVHLLPLHRVLCHQLGDPQGDMVMRRSTRYVSYPRLNRSELPTADTSIIKPGLPLQAMVASRRPNAMYFKLNHSALTGTVLDADDLRDFQDAHPGDVTRCRVKSFSDCGQFVRLQREGHGTLFFDTTTGTMRPMPSRAEAEEVFPSRGSSLRDLGKRGGGGLSFDKSSFKEKKPDIIYRSGKRGVPKLRKPDLKLPKLRGEHKSFDPSFPS